jgi:UDP-N-acetylglucosamine--N-acetylmuramyl-(pentapeptide) pyrophosphoryl-undecaprenol N-acetylglucosamine transferase
VAKRVLIAAGGTGGHFYPGLVLAQALKARGWQPLFLLRVDDPAVPRLEKEGIASVQVPLKGMPRSLGPALLSWSVALAKSLGLVSRVVRDFRPDAVVGFGGYLTFPAVVSAARRGVPRALHESNTIPGLANKASAAFRAQLFWGLPPLCGKGKLVGTPIRQALWSRANAAESRRKLGLPADGKVVLAFGGSQGAKGLNEKAPAILSKLPVTVLHLAGKDSVAAVEARYKQAGGKAVVLPFLDDMEAAYGAADVVVSRSGASTLAELAAQRAQAVLVPFPFAAGNHQELNARSVEKTGAVRVVLERDLDAGLEAAVSELLASPSGEKWAALGLPAPDRAAAALADAVEALK